MIVVNLLTKCSWYNYHTAAWNFSTRAAFSELRTSLVPSAIRNTKNTKTVMNSKLLKKSKVIIVSQVCISFFQVILQNHHGF